jgi:hypothetical protein
MKTEKFAIYGFEMNYPEGWEVKINKKTERFQGAVLFASQDGLAISVTWGFPEYFTSSEEENPEISEGIEETLNRLRKTVGIKELKVVEDRTLEIQGHKGMLKEMQIKVQAGGLWTKKTAEQRGVITQFYCQQNERYFSVYGVPTDKFTELKDAFNTLVQSLKCH